MNLARKKNNEMVIATCNVWCFNQGGSLRNLKDKVKKYKIGIASLQEKR
jgi:hypothetical protein